MKDINALLLSEFANKHRKHNETRQNSGPLLTSVLFDDLRAILCKEMA